MGHSFIVLFVLFEQLLFFVGLPVGFIFVCRAIASKRGARDFGIPHRIVAVVTLVLLAMPPFGWLGLLLFTFYPGVIVVLIPPLMIVLFGRSLERYPVLLQCAAVFTALLGVFVLLTDLGGFFNYFVAGKPDYFEVRM